MPDCKPSITVLFDGYSKPNDIQENSLANCTCTLIKSGEGSSTTYIIVDTMTAWDGGKLKQALTTHDVPCKDINYVICTHGHSDHIGCNYLFPNAIHIVGHSISHRDQYFDHDFKSGKEYIINSYIKVVATPGHTLQDVSVIVDSTVGICAITGDLFECEQDLGDDTIWKNAGSDSEELQIVNRTKILSLADFIIPGHGPMFRVTTKQL